MKQVGYLIQNFMQFGISRGIITQISDLHHLKAVVSILNFFPIYRLTAIGMCEKGAKIREPAKEETDFFELQQYPRRRKVPKRRNLALWEYE